MRLFTATLLTAAALATGALAGLAREAAKAIEGAAVDLDAADVNEPERNRDTPKAHPEFDVPARWFHYLTETIPVRDEKSGKIVLPPYLWNLYNRALIVLRSPEPLTPADLGMRDND